MMEPAIWIVVSLALLFFGAEWLVRGAADLAVRFGLTPLVIGLTVVAYGTSTPELVVSTGAALKNQGDISVGNVIGSNLFNICVILGLAAVLHPLKVQLQLLKLDAPIMVGASLVVIAMLHDLRVDRIEAAILFIGILSYTLFNVRLARKETSSEVKQEFQEALPPKLDSPWRDVAVVLGGLGLLVLGSNLLVEHSVSLARMLGVSEAVIGLTIVSAGTSMPELATSVIAALRKQPDIALGNVIGSNVFNLLGILGVSALVTPLSAPGIQMRDLYVMLGATLLLLPLLRTGLVIQRWEGALLLAGYGVYLGFLWPK